jgi:hypothetical protein
MAGPTLFVSVFAYALHKTTGGAAFNAVVQQELAAGELATWSCFRTLNRLRRYYDVGLMLDGSTLIAKARSRAVGAFLASGADVWVSIDDDVEASPEALCHLVDSARALGIVSTAIYARESDRVNIDLPQGETFMRHIGAANLVNVTSIGVSLAAFARPAVERMVEFYPELAFQEDPAGVMGSGLFLEHVEDGRWVGEDIMFCRRAQGCSVPIYALCDHPVMHAGRPYTLTLLTDS